MASESFANDAGPSSSSPSTVTEKAATKPASVSVDSGPVQAYAKLEGDEYCYYIRTLQVTMGRRVSRPGQVDIPLGNAKSVSRHHARLFYNFATQRFEIMVFGKNGAFINEQFVEKGITVPLENRTKIQIGDSSFTFLLPRVNVGQQSAASRVNDSSGYISTPQQLEKHSSRASDADGNDSQDPSSYPANKDGKPPFSYATLIAQAINSTDDKRMALHEIYNYITTHYPYYQMAQNGWQNSIRHNLSLNKAFVKVPRGDAEPGKGAFWTIDPKAEIQFMNGGMNKRNGKRPASKASGAANDSGSSPTPEPRKKIKKEGSDNDEAASSSTGAATSTTTTTAATSGKSAATAATPAATAAIASAAAASTAASMTQSPATTKDTSSSSTSSPNTTSTASTSTTASATNTQQNIQAQIQLQLQSQLQTTIRQHLLDPVRYPLPPSIAQLLPQAIAQLPPHLANQFSATLQSALRAHSNASNNNNNSNNTTTNSSGSETKSKSNAGDKSSSNEPANKSS